MMDSKLKIEEVEAVEAPPKARVEDEAPRRRDYLSGFLQEKPQDVPTGQPGGAVYDAIIEALKDIYDPEIPVNIYDLGLIYEVFVEEDNTVRIVMTLTSPNCPVAESLPEEVVEKVQSIEGVKEVELHLTFDPPWTKEMLSDEALLELGLL